jgi:hypothetical protein
MAVTSNTHLYRRGGIDEFKKKNFCSRFISPWWYFRTFEINAMAIKSRFYGIFIETDISENKYYILNHKQLILIRIRKKDSFIVKEININIYINININRIQIGLYK